MTGAARNNNTGATRASNFGNHEYMDDAAYAASLQQMELMMAAQHTGAVGGDGSHGADSGQDSEGTVIEDPVWGRYGGTPGRPMKPFTLLCVSMCPCCVPPYCSPSRKQAYHKVLRTACFWLSVLQFLLWIVSLCFRGFAPTSVNPMLGPWPDTLNLLQAKNAAEILYNYQLWRLVMPIFLHAGLIHLATNLAMQLRMGLFLEVSWGTARFLQIYFGSGILASAFSAVTIPDKIGVGASGALMGVMGAWFVQLLMTWGEGPDHVQQARSFQFIMCVVNIFVIIGFSFVPFVDWAAHLFGLVGGAFIEMWLAGLKLTVGPTMPKWKKHLYTWGGLGAFLGLFLAALLAIYTKITPDKTLLNYCKALLYPYYDVDCPSGFK